MHNLTHLMTIFSTPTSLPYQPIPVPHTEYISFIVSNYTVSSQDHDHLSQSVSFHDIAWLLQMKQTEVGIKHCLQQQSLQISEIIQNVFPPKQFFDFYDPKNPFAVGISCSMTLKHLSIQYTFFIRHRKTQHIQFQKTIVTHDSLADLYDKWHFHNTKLDIEEQLQLFKQELLQRRHRFTSFFQRFKYWIQQWFGF